MSHDVRTGFALDSEHGCGLSVTLRRGPRRSAGCICSACRAFAALLAEYDRLEPL